MEDWQQKSLFPYWDLPKNKNLKDRAKQLRKQGIISEVVFWSNFKDQKLLGYDIDRQVIIGKFIVDFFIPELGLVFEIDGASHNDKIEEDGLRDLFLEKYGLKVIHIRDKEVLHNLDNLFRFVLECIGNRERELKTTQLDNEVKN